MAYRTAHGRARELGALVTVEAAPPDELPPGVPAAPASPVERREDGTLTPEGARELGRRGGQRAAERRRFAAQLADTLGMGTVGEPLAPYVEAAREYAEAHIADLAQSVGGGRVGPGPASLVQSAALALAASRYMYAEGSKDGDAKLLGQAAQLADKSRTSLLTAHELAAREAQARRASQGALDAHEVFGGPPLRAADSARGIPPETPPGSFSGAPSPPREDPTP